MKLPAYPRTKPSGVKWLGDVPEHWEVKRSDAIVSADRSQLSPEAFADRDVFHYSIPVVQETGTGQVENGESIASAKQVVKKPVVLVSKLNPRKATICLAKPQAILTLCSTEFVALNADKCELAFLEYLTRSELFRQSLDSKVQSVTRSHQRANPADIYKFWNAWPTLEDQRAIAAFLDRETGRMDRLVAKKRELIERLKEKRTALISRTVTRGLPAEAAAKAGLPASPPLKPSGAEWLGNIPEHWEVKKGRYVGVLFGSVAPTEEELIEDDSAQEGDLPFAKVDDLNQINGSLKLVSTKARARGCRARKGALLLFPKRGAAIFTNKVAIAEKPLLFDPNLMGWQINSSFAVKFVAYCLIARRLNDLADVSTVPQINNKHIYPAAFPRPPLPEQAAIAAYLDEETAKLDALVGKVEEAVERLQEYRTALITAAVTGKIDVRKETHG